MEGWEVGGKHVQGEGLGFRRLSCASRKHMSGEWGWRGPGTGPETQADWPPGTGSGRRVARTIWAS